MTAPVLPADPATFAPIPLVDLKAQYATIKDEIDAAVAGVLARADFVMGGAVSAFETQFAAYSGVPYALGVGSGTDALFLALKALGVGPGDEILVPDMTFTATAEAVAYCGATPVLVDVHPGDLLLDLERAERAITPHTVGVLPVHLYGNLVDLDALRGFAERTGLWVLEDAAQAHGATWCGQQAGSVGRAACYSFYPGKNLGAAGDAGMIVTRDPALAEQVRLLRDHGRTSKYEHAVVGYGSRLDTLQAAVLQVKLRHLPGWTEQRRVAAARYDELIGDRLARIGSARREGAVHHIYAVRVPAERRDTAVAQLQARGIGAGIHYPIPLHRQPAYAHLGYASESFPVATRAAGELLSLPLFPEITPEQQQRVVDALFQALAAD